MSDDVNSQTVFTMGDRSLKARPQGAVASFPHCSVLLKFARTLLQVLPSYKLCCVSPEVSFATKYNETSTILALEHDLRKAEEAIEREGGIRMVIWTPQSKTPPETHLLCFDYSY